MKGKWLAIKGDSVVDGVGAEARSVVGVVVRLVGVVAQLLRCVVESVGECRCFANGRFK